MHDVRVIPLDGRPHANVPVRAHLGDARGRFQGDTLIVEVALAELLAEDRRPGDDFWNQTLVSSRLIEYEVWTRLHARKLARTHGEAARALVGRVALLELVSPVLMRALEPFPKSVRTLDALHLASTEFLRERQPAIRLATYDSRQAAAAKAMGIALYDLDAGT